MEKIETHLNNLLVEVFNRILKFEESSLKLALGSSVTVTEAHILEVIGKSDEEITVSEIASALDITLPTATIALKKLTSKGFITKTACTKDARRFLVKLTKNGEIINRAHELFHKQMIANIVYDLTEEEKHALLSAVKKINVFFGKKVNN